MRKAIADHFGVSAKTWTDVRKRNNDARAAAIFLHRSLTSESLGSLAECYGGVGTAAISKTMARAEMRRCKDRRWDRTLRQLEKTVVG